MRYLRSQRWLVGAALGITAAVAVVAAVVYVHQAAKRPVLPAQARPTPRPRWRRPPRPGIAALAAVFVAIALVGGAYGYDVSKSDVIASGVHVGSVNVGGLSERAARIKISRAYSRLYRPVVLRSEGRQFVFYPGRAGLAVDVDGTISRALDRGRQGWFLPRAVRELMGKNVDANIRPGIRVSVTAVSRFAERVETAVDRAPRSARVVPTPDRLIVKRSEDGLEVDAGRLRQAIERALLRPNAPRKLAVPAHRTPTRVTVADLRRRYRSFITVDRSAFTLRVYQHLKLARSYTIAVGQVGLETPAGLYHIENKTVNPSWSVPNSAWAGSLAGAVIPPGPDNPLQARWMGIFAGAGIHGTFDTGSLGSAASHGCIRMAVPDVIDLYDRVQVGTPIYIG